MVDEGRRKEGLVELHGEIQQNAGFVVLPGGQDLAGDKLHGGEQLRR